MCETLQFLDCICGSTTGGLGLLGLYINEKNVALINQTLESLTEYCQGPCHENQVHGGIPPDWNPTRTSGLGCHSVRFVVCVPQNCIATHESNGIDIIIALILNDINPLGKKRMDLVLELKVSSLSSSEMEEVSAHLLKPAKTMVLANWWWEAGGGGRSSVKYLRSALSISATFSGLCASPPT